MSGPLGSVERAIEAVVERPFARLFRVRVQPEQVLRELERAADRAAGVRGRDPVPGAWEARVDPGSPLLADDARDALEGWLAETLRRHLVVRGRSFAAQPSVRLIADPAVGRSSVVVVVAVDPASAQPATSPRADAGAAAEVAPPASADAVTGARLFLEVHAPGMPVRRRRVPAGDLAIGRGRGAVLHIPHASVSRAHGRLTVRHGVLVYVDLGSRNGSWLNGIPVAEAAVGVGDRIDIGAAAIVVTGMR